MFERFDHENSFICIIILVGILLKLHFIDCVQMQKTELVRALETAIEDAEKCLCVIQQLDLNKMRTRTRHHDPKYRLSVRELTLFAQEIDALACVLPEGSAVKEVLRQTSEFETRAKELLSEDLDDIEPSYVREVEETVELGSGLCIVLPELCALSARAAQLRFVVECRRAREAAPAPPAIRRLIQQAGEVPPHAAVDIETQALHTLLGQFSNRFFSSEQKLNLLDS